LEFYSFALQVFQNLFGDQFPRSRDVLDVRRGQPLAICKLPDLVHPFFCFRKTPERAGRVFDLIVHAVGNDIDVGRRERFANAFDWSLQKLNVLAKSLQVRGDLQFIESAERERPLPGTIGRRESV
jgi:hypothetical protein